MGLNNRKMQEDLTQAMSDALLMQWLKSQASLIPMLPKVAQGSLCKEAAARTIGSGVVSMHYLPMSEPKGKADAVSTLKSEWNNGCYRSEKGSPTCPGAAVALPVAPSIQWPSALRSSSVSHAFPVVKDA